MFSLPCKLFSGWWQSSDWDHVTRCHHCHQIQETVVATKNIINALGWCRVKLD